MGLSQSIESKTREVLTTQRLLDVKQKKRERDITQSMQMAATRDRLCWIAGYYATVAVVSVARHGYMHRKGIHLTWDNFCLPLNQVLICIPPFLFGYQVDYALFNKGERIAAEAARIREGKQHRWFGNEWLPESSAGSLLGFEIPNDSDRWFNQPLELPQALEPSYGRIMAEADEARAAAGEPPAPRWARFSWAPP